MPTDFSSEYSQRSDDELLHLASERHSLTTEAAAALDAELRRRNLTESDRVEYQKFVKRQERRESRKRRRWKMPGLKDRWTWRDILEAFATMALISLSYFALPSHYRLKPDWQEAAVIVMITSVAVFFTFKSWRKIALWTSLVISSAIQLVLLHVWTQRVPMLSRGEERGAGALGVLLFLAVYGVVRFLQRRLYDKETTNRARDDSRSYPVGEKSR
jgi:hypothetical protein